jgi:hypothetical protein
MYEKLLTDVEEVIELARETGDVELFSELLLLKAIAVAEYGMMIATGCDKTSQNEEPPSFSHPPLQTISDTCISGATDECGNQTEIVKNLHPHQKTLKDKV